MLARSHSLLAQRRTIYINFEGACQRHWEGPSRGRGKKGGLMLLNMSIWRMFNA